jgi:alpha-beta hydrolase superfamily lysophospholipase
LRLILISTLVILAATYVVSLLVRLVLFRKRANKKKERRWHSVLLRNLAIAVPLALVLLPIVLGFAGSRLVHTRHDEAAYQGPRIAADGEWHLQSRDTLEAEANGERTVDPALRASAAGHRVQIVTADGLDLRAFLVPAKVAPPTARVVMVHGLFRGALELETVARMFHDLGAEVLMLELRNHGASARAPATYGLREAEDVLAAARFVQQQQQQHHSSGPAPPLILFGVSLGTAAVALAAPELPELAGLVLDAPMTDLLGAARRVLGGGLGMPGPLASATLWSIELLSGFSMTAVQPHRKLAKLQGDIAVLVIGAGGDRRCPPPVVREVFRALRVPEEQKQLWILEGAHHGRVWEQDAHGYRERLALLLARVRR